MNVIPIYIYSDSNECISENGINTAKVTGKDTVKSTGKYTGIEPEKGTDSTT